MKLTTVVKLHTSEEEHAALLQTLRTCNAACDLISRIAFEHKIFRRFDLHHLTYHNMRAATPLAAGHVVCAIAKAASAYKQGADVLRTFDPVGGIEFNKDTLAWKVEEQTVSVNSVCGRLRLPFLCSGRDKALLRGRRGQADLLLRNGQFYLSVCVTVLEAAPFVPTGVIGIDLGMVPDLKWRGQDRTDQVREGGDGIVVRSGPVGGCEDRAERDQRHGQKRYGAQAHRSPFNRLGVVVAIRHGASSLYDAEIMK